VLCDACCATAVGTGAGVGAGAGVTVTVAVGTGDRVDAAGVGCDCEVAVEYPFYRVGDVLCCHGHYLDAHVQGSVANRMFTRDYRKPFVVPKLA